jgi:hypothetical protein
MALTIHKQPLTMAPEQFMALPLGAEMLTVELQYGSPMLWYRCDPDEPKETRSVRCAGTGHPVSVGKHLGTCIVMDDQLVWHYFEGVR